jgi:5-(carboxyamino)imidazole ribonucleotide synthase
MSQTPPSNPAKTLGILGGGQLGRMSALAAARLGIEVHIFSPEKNCPASSVAAKTIVAEYSDKQALRDFAKNVDVVSYEFENIPLETVAFLAKLKPIHPDIKLLEISQHRWKEKEFLNTVGVPTARWAKAHQPSDVKITMEKFKITSCILKTCTLGYDGKGQAKFTQGMDIDSLWNKLKSKEIIVEDLIDFKCEISCLVARDIFGGLALYDPVLNEHKDHILSKSAVPAPLPAPLLKKAKSYAKKIAEHIDLVGILAIEFFVTDQGELLANEMAPRPHNSGHWTIDACAVSQFEQHVRTVCGLPVGATTRHSDAIMLNLIGDDIALCQKYLTKPNVCIHAYGKTEIRSGRKMGHITFLKNKTT